MSVINQMLQNIDNKKNKPAEPADEDLSYTRLDIPKKSSYKRVAYIVLAGGVLFATLWVAGVYDDANVHSFNAVKNAITPQESQVAPEGGAEVLAVDVYADKPAVTQNDNPVRENQALETSQVVESAPELIEDAPSPSPSPSQVTIPTDSAETTLKAEKADQSTETAQRTAKTVIEIEVPSEPVVKATEQSANVIKSTEDTASKAHKRNSAFSMTPTEKSADELARKALNKGNEAYNRGRFSLAEIEYKKALSINPALHEARAQWVGLLYGEKNHQQALSVLQQGINKYPEHTGYRLLAARVWLSLEQPHSALNVLLGHTPQERELEYYQLSAALAQQTEQWSLALQNWQALLLNNRPQGKWLLGAAIAFEKLGKAKEADKHYKQALTVGGLSQSSLEFIKLKLTKEE